MLRHVPLRSLALLHPTFETWGGAEWTIHGLLASLARRFDVRAALVTHRYDAIAGANPPYEVVEHHAGGELSSESDWRSIADAIGRRLEAADVVMVHNYPAVHWIGEGVRTPVVWYCHEPPRRLHGPHSEEVELNAGPPRSPRELASAVMRHGTKSIPLALRRLRLLRDTRPADREARLEELGRLEARAVARVRAIVANSRYTAERVEQIYGRDAEVVVPVPSDFDGILSVDAAKERLVVWAGRLSTLKRPVEMLRGWCHWRTLNDPERSWRLVMVGEGPLGGELRRLADDEAGGSVELIDRLPRRDLIALFARALLVVHTARAEPLGLVPLEAMGAGTAVLAHAEGGVTDTVEPGTSGWLVELEDAPSLALALTEALGDEAALAATGRTARERARERFDFGASVGRLHAILAGAASGDR